LGLLTFLWKQETLFGFGKFTFAVGTWQMKEWRTK
jgi:hypothetical protein